MSKLGNITIETDLITVSKIQCRNLNCIYNLSHYPGDWTSCNLKYVEIDNNGVCKNKEEKKEQAEKNI